VTLSTTRMTAAEFLALPEDPNKVRYELVHGEVIVSPSPDLGHGFVVTRLLSLIDRYVQDHDLGFVFTDIDTRFTDEDVRRPDIFYFAKARVHLLQGRRYPDDPPDLCVEVLSPSNSRFDRVDKFDLYQSTAVNHYWIVDPMARTIEAYRLDATGAYVSAGRGRDADVVRLPPFPDLEIRLGNVWFPSLP
jgi:Uma2 family endonuclease